MKVLAQCLIVGCAGFCGAIARYAISRTCTELFGSGSWLATFIINITGAFALGWFMSREHWIASEPLRLSIAVGFLGAYTTFSTWMYESDALMRQGATFHATANLLGSLLLGLLAVRMGMIAGKP